MSKILLVDDEEGIRLILGRQLKRAGHEITQASDGMEAVEYLEHGEFDLILSDMNMPRLDGMGLLAKALNIAPSTEFIILTGHGNLENAVEAFKTGNVFDYLLKPLDDITQLNAIVGRALERRSLKSENTRLIAELQTRIDELEKAKDSLAKLAERDGLTELLNYRAIHHRLNTALRQADSVSVVLVDLDGFKMMNDTYGHPTGDKVLQHVADHLRAACPENGFAGRCGGDEFMVVLPDMTGDGALDISVKIRENLHAHPFINPEGTSLPIHICFGIANSSSTDRSAISLLAAADGALYESKHSGGDTATLHMVARNEDDGRPTHNAYSVLDGLLTAVDNKDRYTRQHSEHMTGFALQIAQKLGLSDQTCEIVRVAGLLHDVGKIGVPDAVLRKPGKLTNEEYEMMKTHVTLSTAIIHGLPHLSDIMDAVSYHHERWDGKGYPTGKAGMDIPLLGRIMAVADAFSAMTLDRPYRAGLNIEIALHEIEKGAGTQFDPTLAKLFVEAMREHLATEPASEKKAA